MNKPRILITNDDGIHAQGIKHLWHAVKDYATTYIVAPKCEQSGTGASISICKTVHVDGVSWEEQTPAWSVTGTPVDCIKMASSILLPFSPDIVLSGINRGANAGRTVLYSGTIGSVIEAVLRGLSGIAFSSFDHDNTEYALFEPYIPKIVTFVLQYPLAKGTLLNVNFPSMLTLQALGLSDVAGIMLTRQGKQYWMEDILCHESSPGYFFDAKLMEFEEEANSDIFWLQKGYITCVPIHVEELTDWRYIESHKTLFEKQTFSQMHQDALVPAAGFSQENDA